MNVNDISPVVRSIYFKLATLTNDFADIVLIMSSYKPIWLVLKLVTFPAHVLPKRATGFERVVNRIVKTNDRPSYI